MVFSHLYKHVSSGQLSSMQLCVKCFLVVNKQRLSNGLVIYIAVYQIVNSHLCNRVSNGLQSSISPCQMVNSNLYNRVLNGLQLSISPYVKQSIVIYVTCVKCFLVVYTTVCQLVFGNQYSRVSNGLQSSQNRCQLKQF